jgi:RNA polymerase sigma factor for flagellar operon FliA
VGGGGEPLEDPLGWIESLARQVARRTGTWVDLDELVGLGAQGLLEAERRFDSARGVPFTAYARVRVQGAMLDGLRALAPVPPSVQRAGAGPSAAAARHCARFASARADGLLVETAEAREGPVAAAPAEEGPEALAEQRELRRLVVRALAELPSAEQELVIGHALDDQPLERVAQTLGLGAERGRQLYQRALLRLRAHLRVTL